jgi:hypothetical protein
MSIIPILNLFTYQHATGLPENQEHWPEIQEANYCFDIVTGYL